MFSTTHNPNKDIEVPDVPSDGISSLNWSPKANYFVATSWDNTVIDQSLLHHH